MIVMITDSPTLHLCEYHPPMPLCHVSIILPCLSAMPPSSSYVSLLCLIHPVLEELVCSYFPRTLHISLATGRICDVGQCVGVGWMDRADGSKAVRTKSLLCPRG